MKHTLLKKVGFFVLILISSIIMVSCQQEEIEEPIKSYLVSFRDYNNTIIKTETVLEGNKATPPENPQREMYDFLHWIYEGDAKIYEETDIIIDNTTLIAVYKESDTYLVAFNTLGGTLVDSIKILPNNKVDKPKNPTKIGYKFKGWFNDETLEDEFDFNDLIREDKILYAKFVLEELNMPIILIDLEDVNLESVEREKYVDAKVSVINHEFDIIEDSIAEFRGRGHGSWGYDKKGYRIKFNEKTSLFGEAKNKHWVLVANGHDNSMLRHGLAYLLSSQNLTNIEYTTSVNMVELYVNGEYRGVYSLFEHQRVSKERVNIDKEFGVLDTGYFLEYDAYGDEEGIEDINYFRVNGLKYPFEIKSPDPDDYLDEGLTTEEYKEQVSFIKNFLQEVVDAMNVNDLIRFRELVDIDSFVDMYILHEFMKNTDTGWSSFYLAKKKSGKLYLTAPWDFDLSSGITRGDQSVEGLYVSNGVLQHSPSTANEFFINLMNNKIFVNLVKTRFLEVEAGFLITINNTFNDILKYNSSFNRDAQLWTDGNNLYKSEQDNLKNWLLNRHVWFKNWALN